APDAAAGQDHSTGSHSIRLSPRSRGYDSAAGSIIADKIQHYHIFPQDQILPKKRRVQQRLRDLPAGYIFMIEDPGPGMGPLSGKIKAAVRTAGKTDSSARQIPDHRIGG